MREMNEEDRVREKAVFDAELMKSGLIGVGSREMRDDATVRMALELLGVTSKAASQLADYYPEGGVRRRVRVAFAAAKNMKGAITQTEAES